MSANAVDTAFIRRAVELTLVTEVASAYFDLRARNRQEQAAAREVRMRLRHVGRHAPIVTGESYAGAR